MVAAALASSGDKAMTTHATALWGAAAALVGMPTAATQAPVNIDPSTAEVYLRALAHKANGLMFGMSSTPAQQAAIIGTVLDKIKAHEFADREQRRAAHDRTIAALNALAAKAADIIPGAKCSTPDEKATLIGTALDRVRDMKPTLDKALADIHALRDILGVPDGGNLVDHADAAMKDHANERETCDHYRREWAILRAQVNRMIAAMREDAPASTPSSAVTIRER